MRADDNLAQHFGGAGVIVGYETCDAHTGVAADDVHGAEVDACVFQADCDLRQRARFVFEADEQRVLRHGLETRIEQEPERVAVAIHGEDDYAVGPVRGDVEALDVHPASCERFGDGGELTGLVGREDSELFHGAIIGQRAVFAKFAFQIAARSAFLRPMSAHIGIIGGSGLYQIDGLTNITEHNVDTPFGPPSDTIFSGELGGRRIFFLPRHARGHRILPHELPHRANIWALRSLGVRFIICVTAVGSLQQQYEPRHIVLPSQFFDRTSQIHTFFGAGIVAHASFAEPICEPLHHLLYEAGTAAGYTLHKGGTYVNMDGPQFSTRAESETNRKLGFDVIGMTNLAEVKLCREAEIAVATMAMITDYDCWKVEEEPVTADAVIAHLMANAAAAKAILAQVVPRIPAEANWPEHRALDSALVTDRALWPAQTAENLRPILARFL